MTRKDRRIIIIVILLLLFITIACDTSGQDPKDERIQEPVQEKVNLTNKMLTQLGSLNNSDLYIEQITPLSKVNNNSGMWIFDVMINTPDANDFKLFEFSPSGCTKVNMMDITNVREVELFETSSQSILNSAATKGKLSYRIKATPGNFLAVEKETEINSGKIDFSDNVFYLVSEINNWTPTITSPNDDEIWTDNFELNVKSYPNLCLSLSINGEKVDDSEVNSKGNWSTNINALDYGENSIKVTVENAVISEGISSATKELDYKKPLSKGIDFNGTIDKVADYDPQVKRWYSRNSDTSGIDSNCTWYAAAAVKYWSEKLGVKKEGLPYEEGYSNPINWITMAESYGYRVDHSPEPGSVIILEEYNHAGFVEDVKFNNKLNEYIITWGEEHFYITKDNIGISGVNWKNHPSPVQSCWTKNGSSVWRWTQTIRFDESYLNTFITFIHFLMNIIDSSA